MLNFWYCKAAVFKNVEITVPSLFLGYTVQLGAAQLGAWVPQKYTVIRFV
jgi:hypothetical protein